MCIWTVLKFVYGNSVVVGLRHRLMGGNCKVKHSIGDMRYYEILDLITWAPMLDDVGVYSDAHRRCC